VLTLTEACSDAAATVVDWMLVCSAVLAIVSAVARISVAAAASASSSPRTDWSKLDTDCSSAA
jgi:hypothetical protein